MDLVEKERKICVAVVYMRIPLISDELDLQVGVFQL